MTLYDGGNVCVDSLYRNDVPLAGGDLRCPAGTFITRVPSSDTPVNSSAAASLCAKYGFTLPDSETDDCLFDFNRLLDASVFRAVWVKSSPSNVVMAYGGGQSVSQVPNHVRCVLDIRNVNCTSSFTVVSEHRISYNDSKFSCEKIGGKLLRPNDYHCVNNSLPVIPYDSYYWGTSEGYAMAVAKGEVIGHLKMDESNFLRSACSMPSTSCSGLRYYLNNVAMSLSAATLHCTATGGVLVPPAEFSCLKQLQEDTSVVVLSAWTEIGAVRLAGNAATAFSTSGNLPSICRLAAAASHCNSVYVYKSNHVALYSDAGAKCQATRGRLLTPGDLTCLTQDTARATPYFWVLSSDGSGLAVRSNGSSVLRIAPGAIARDVMCIINATVYSCRGAHHFIHYHNAVTATQAEAACKRQGARLLEVGIPLDCFTSFLRDPFGAPTTALPIWIGVGSGSATQVTHDGTLLTSAVSAGATAAFTCSYVSNCTGQQASTQFQQATVCRETLFDVDIGCQADTYITTVPGGDVMRSGSDAEALCQEFGYTLASETTEDCLFAYNRLLSSPSAFTNVWWKNVGEYSIMPFDGKDYNSSSGKYAVRCALDVGSSIDCSSMFLFTNNNTLTFDEANASCSGNLLAPRQYKCLSALRSLDISATTYYWGGPASAFAIAATKASAVGGHLLLHAAYKLPSLCAVTTRANCSERFFYVDSRSLTHQEAETSCQTTGGNLLTRQYYHCVDGIFEKSGPFPANTWTGAGTGKALAWSGANHFTEFTFAGRLPSVCNHSPKASCAGKLRYLVHPGLPSKVTNAQAIHACSSVGARPTPSEFYSCLGTPLSPVIPTDYFWAGSSSGLALKINGRNYPYGEARSTSELLPYVCSAPEHNYTCEGRQIHFFSQTVVSASFASSLCKFFGAGLINVATPPRCYLDAFKLAPNVDSIWVSYSSEFSSAMIARRAGGVLRTTNVSEQATIACTQPRPCTGQEMSGSFQSHPVCIASMYRSRYCPLHSYITTVPGGDKLYSGKDATALCAKYGLSLASEITPATHLCISGYTYLIPYADYKPYWVHHTTGSGQGYKSVTYGTNTLIASAGMHQVRCVGGPQGVNCSFSKVSVTSTPMSYADATIACQTTGRTLITAKYYHCVSAALVQNSMASVQYYWVGPTAGFALAVDKGDYTVGHLELHGTHLLKSICHSSTVHPYVCDGRAYHFHGNLFSADQAADACRTAGGSLLDVDSKPDCYQQAFGLSHTGYPVWTSFSNGVATSLKFNGAVETSAQASATNEFVCTLPRKCTGQQFNDTLFGGSHVCVDTLYGEQSKSVCAQKGIYVTITPGGDEQRTSDSAGLLCRKYSLTLPGKQSHDCLLEFNRLLDASQDPTWLAPLVSGSPISMSYSGNQTIANDTDTYVTRCAIDVSSTVCSDRFFYVNNVTLDYNSANTSCSGRLIMPAEYNCLRAVRTARAHSTEYFWAGDNAGFAVAVQRGASIVGHLKLHGEHLLQSICSVSAAAECGDRFFYVINKKLSYSDALSRCTGTGGTLLTQTYFPCYKARVNQVIGNGGISPITTWVGGSPGLAVSWNGGDEFTAFNSIGLHRPVCQRLSVSGNCSVKRRYLLNPDVAANVTHADAVKACKDIGAVAASQEVFACIATNASPDIPTGYFWDGTILGVALKTNGMYYPYGYYRTPTDLLPYICSRPYHEHTCAGARLEFYYDVSLSPAEGAAFCERFGANLINIAAPPRCYMEALLKDNKTSTAWIGFLKSPAEATSVNNNGTSTSGQTLDRAVVCTYPPKCSGQQSNGKISGVPVCIENLFRNSKCPVHSAITNVPGGDELYTDVEASAHCQKYGLSLAGELNGASEDCIFEYMTLLPSDVYKPFWIHPARGYRSVQYSSRRANATGKHSVRCVVDYGAVECGYSVLWLDTTPLSYEDGKKACRAMGGDLITPQYYQCIATSLRFLSSALPMHVWAGPAAGFALTVNHGNVVVGHLEILPRHLLHSICRKSKISTHSCGGSQFQYYNVPHTATEAALACKKAGTSLKNVRTPPTCFSQVPATFPVWVCSSGTFATSVSKTGAMSTTALSVTTRQTFMCTLPSLCSGQHNTSTFEDAPVCVDTLYKGVITNVPGGDTEVSRKNATALCGNYDLSFAGLIEAIPLVEFINQSYYTPVTSVWWGFGAVTPSNKPATGSVHSVRCAITSIAVCSQTFLFVNNISLGHTEAVTACSNKLMVPKEYDCFKQMRSAAAVTTTTYYWTGKTAGFAAAVDGGNSVSGHLQIHGTHRLPSICSVDAVVKCSERFFYINKTPLSYAQAKRSCEDTHGKLLSQDYYVCLKARVASGVAESGIFSSEGPFPVNIWSGAGQERAVSWAGNDDFTEYAFSGDLSSVCDLGSQQRNCPVKLKYLVNKDYDANLTIPDATRACNELGSGTTPVNLYFCFGSATSPIIPTGYFWPGATPLALLMNGRGYPYGEFRDGYTKLPYLCSSVVYENTCGNTRLEYYYEAELTPTNGAKFCRAVGAQLINLATDVTCYTGAFNGRTNAAWITYVPSSSTAISLNRVGTRSVTIRSTQLAVICSYPPTCTGQQVTGYYEGHRVCSEMLYRNSLCPAHSAITTVPDGDKLHTSAEAAALCGKYGLSLAGERSEKCIVGYSNLLPSDKYTEFWIHPARGYHSVAHGGATAPSNGQHQVRCVIDYPATDCSGTLLWINNQREAHGFAKPQCQKAGGSLLSAEYYRCLPSVMKTQVSVGTEYFWAGSTPGFALVVEKGNSVTGHLKLPESHPLRSICRSSVADNTTCTSHVLYLNTRVLDYSRAETACKETGGTLVKPDQYACITSTLPSIDEANTKAWTAVVLSEQLRTSTRNVSLWTAEGETFSIALGNPSVGLWDQYGVSYQSICSIPSLKFTCEGHQLAYHTVHLTSALAAASCTMVGGRLQRSPLLPTRCYQQAWVISKAMQLYEHTPLWTDLFSASGNAGSLGKTSSDVAVATINERGSHFVCTLGGRGTCSTQQTNGTLNYANVCVETLYRNESLTKGTTTPHCPPGTYITNVPRGAANWTSLDASKHCKKYGMAIPDSRTRPCLVDFNLLLSPSDYRPMWIWTSLGFLGLQYGNTVVAGSAHNTVQCVLNATTGDCSTRSFHLEATKQKYAIANSSCRARGGELVTPEYYSCVQKMSRTSGGSMYLWAGAEPGFAVVVKAGNTIVGHLELHPDMLLASLCTSPAFSTCPSFTFFVSKNKVSYADADYACRNRSASLLARDHYSCVLAALPQFHSPTTYFWTGSTAGSALGRSDDTNFYSQVSYPQQDPYHFICKSATGSSCTGHYFYIRSMLVPAHSAAAQCAAGDKLVAPSHFHCLKGMLASASTGPLTQYYWSLSAPSYEAVALLDTSTPIVRTFLPTDAKPTACEAIVTDYTCDGVEFRMHPNPANASIAASTCATVGGTLVRDFTVSRDCYTMALQYAAPGATALWISFSVEADTYTQVDSAGQHNVSTSQLNAGKLGFVCTHTNTQKCTVQQTSWIVNGTSVCLDTFYRNEVQAGSRRCAAGGYLMNVPNGNQSRTAVDAAALCTRYGLQVPRSDMDQCLVDFNGQVNFTSYTSVWSRGAVGSRALFFDTASCGRNPTHQTQCALYTVPAANCSDTFFYFTNQRLSHGDARNACESSGGALMSTHHYSCLQAILPAEATSYGTYWAGSGSELALVVTNGNTLVGHLRIHSSALLAAICERTSSGNCSEISLAITLPSENSSHAEAMGFCEDLGGTPITGDYYSCLSAAVKTVSDPLQEYWTGYGSGFGLSLARRSGLQLHGRLSQYSADASNGVICQIAQRTYSCGSLELVFRSALLDATQASLSCERSGGKLINHVLLYSDCYKEAFKFVSGTKSPLWIGLTPQAQLLQVDGSVTSTVNTTAKRAFVCVSNPVCPSGTKEHNIGGSIFCDAFYPFNCSGASSTFELHYQSQVQPAGAAAICLEANGVLQRTIGVPDHCYTDYTRLLAATDTLAGAGPVWIDYSAPSGKATSASLAGIKTTSSRGDSRYFICTKRPVCTGQQLEVKFQDSYICIDDFFRIEKNNGTVAVCTPNTYVTRVPGSDVLRTNLEAVALCDKFGMGVANEALCLAEYNSKLSSAAFADVWVDQTSAAVGSYQVMAYDGSLSSPTGKHATRCRAGKAIECNNTRVSIQTDVLTWQEAQTLCAADSGSLLLTMEDLRCVSGLPASTAFSGSTFYWIGPEQGSAAALTGGNVPYGHYQFASDIRLQSVCLLP